jgi:hypothetical protein
MGIQLKAVEIVTREHWQSHVSLKVAPQRRQEGFKAEARRPVLFVDKDVVHAMTA